MENVDKYITEKLTKFKFNNTKKTDIQGFIATAISALDAEQAKINAIKNTLGNTDKSSFVNSTTKSQYIKYLDYMHNLIEAKKTKDNSIMTLLELSFDGINTSIIIIRGMENQLRGNKLKELIQLNVVTEYTLRLDENTANALGDSYKKGDRLTINQITQAVNKMIETCKNNIQEYIKEFQENLMQTGKTDIKTGGDYDELGNGSTNNSKSKIKEYKENLTTIKERYEKALKDDIKQYKSLCDLLTKKDGGLLKNIDISIQSLRQNSNLLSQKMGLKLDTLMNPDPFKKNKDLFDNLIRMVNTTKTGLLKNNTLQNNNNNNNNVDVGSNGAPLTKVNTRSVQAIVQKNNANDINSVSGSISSLPKIRPRSVNAIPVQANVPQRKPQNAIDIKSVFGKDVSQESVNIDHDIVQAYIKIFASNDTIIDNDGKIKTLASAEHNGARTTLEDLEKTNKDSYDATKAFLNHVYNEMTKILKDQGKTRDNKELEQQLKNLVALKSGGRRKRKSTKSKKKQSGGFVRGGVLFPESFYRTDVVM